MKYPKNTKFDYPDHTKIRLSPLFHHSFKSYSGFDTGHDNKTWKITTGERELLNWLEEHISPISGYCYRIPMWGKEGWCIRETRSMDHNPEDYSWSRINYYQGSGVVGYYLCIDDRFDNEVVHLKLSGILDQAINPSLFDDDGMK